MAIPNNEYWINRAVQREKRAFKDATSYLEELKLQYIQTIRNIEKDISYFYSRFADENSLSYADSIKYLNTKERKEFQTTLDEFIRIAKNNPDGKYTNLLNTISYRVRITRLQAILTEIQIQVEKLFYEKETGYKPQLYNLLKRIYTDTYNRTFFDMQFGTGIFFPIISLSEFSIKEALDYPWSGSNFSERIWNNKNKLVTQLRNTFTQNIIQGSSVDKITREIRDRMNVSYIDAVRLVRTESNHIYNNGTLRSYADAGIEEYEYLATLDNRTSETCKGLDGKKFKVKDAKPGRNYPPMHVYCRSTTIAVIDNTFVDSAKRIARDDNGKKYYIPANMDYNTWFNTYVKT